MINNNFEQELKNQDEKKFEIKNRSSMLTINPWEYIYYSFNQIRLLYNYGFMYVCIQLGFSFVL